MSHTKEPWEYWENDRTGFGVKMPRKKKTRFGAEPYAVIGGFEPDDRDEMIANARRIVACVNACAGISQETLATVGKWSEAGQATLRELYALREQRDQLLAVLTELQECSAYWSEYDVPLGIVGRIDAAIASVKGGA